MRVFISHKREDTELAKKYAEDFENLGFSFYLDAYDSHISKSNDRGSLINQEIIQSTDLLVIHTKHTKGSWWVPFEVGLSTAAKNRIVTITHVNAPELPSFLRKWPIVTSNKEYAIYLSELKKQNTELLTESRNINFAKSMESLLRTTNTSETFHNKLKTLFGQN